MTLTRLERIRSSAVEFIEAAFELLLAQHVLPCPRFHPYIRVGRDYYGPDVMGIPAFQAFVGVLDEAFVKRFSNATRGLDYESANPYCFSLIEACVASLTMRDEPLDAHSSTAEECIVDLVEYLRKADTEVACARLVSHLTTADGQALQVGDVTVIPVTDEDPVSRLDDVVPGALSAFNRQPVYHFSPPQSLLVSRVSGRNPFAVAPVATARIDRLMLAIRLLFASTSESIYELQGEAHSIRRLDPKVDGFPHTQLPAIRRTTRLDTDSAAPLVSISDLIESLGVDRRKMAVTSLDMALIKYTASFSGQRWYESVVDLATALEAVISGGGTDVSLRLRGRAAALLCTSTDGASAIFNDLKLLYELRSRLVHGAFVRLNNATRCMDSLSTALDEGMPGVRFAQGVDRLRDLVRRGILARLILASGESPLWPFEEEEKVSVDEALADDAERKRWREHWQDQVKDMGCPIAAERARHAVDSLQDDPPVPQVS